MTERPTFASWLIQNGAEMRDVQDALGHETVMMTQRYAHLSKAATASRLGSILDTVTGPMNETSQQPAPPPNGGIEVAGAS